MKPKLSFTYLFAFIFFTNSIYATCYLQVENSSEYNQKILSQTAIAYLNDNIIEEIRPIPMAGLKEHEGCLYNLSVSESDSGLTIIINGRALNGSSTSKLRGIDGFRQALLYSIFNSKNADKRKLCQLHTELLEEQCEERGNLHRFALDKQAKKHNSTLQSNPKAAKKYKMAQIFKKRGKPEKSKKLMLQILDQYPNSREAFLMELFLMSETIQQRSREKQFDSKLLKSALSVPSHYQKLSIYHELHGNTAKWIKSLLSYATTDNPFNTELYRAAVTLHKQSLNIPFDQDLKSEVINWLSGHVIFNSEKERFHEELFEAVVTLPSAFQKTEEYKTLRKNSLAWLIVMGNSENEKNGDDKIAHQYYQRAEKLYLSVKEQLLIQDHIKAAEIRYLLKQGDKDQAEMLLVEWEVDNPDSNMLREFQKQFDMPENMVMIQGRIFNGQMVNSFNIDIYETTNSEFLEFIKANPFYMKSRVNSLTGRDMINDQDYLRRWKSDLTFPEELKNLPVTYISQKVASAYCKWKNKRLPTNQEWGVAAGEGERTYPWGDNEPDKKTAHFGKTMTFGTPAPVDSYPAGKTPEGIYNMGGNVWELTSTIYNGKAIARGGCYFSSAKILRNDNRTSTEDPIIYSSRFTGFRCAQ